MTRESFPDQIWWPDTKPEMSLAQNLFEEELSHRAGMSEDTQPLPPKAGQPRLET